MSGKGLGKVITAPIKAVSQVFGGGSAKPVKIINQQQDHTSQDTAQEQVDKKQQVTNASIARKKNRSLLSTGADSADSGSVNFAQSKKLLGE